MFMEYQNERGGAIVLKEIAQPKKDTWNTVLEAVEDCLALEKKVNEVSVPESKLVWLVISSK